MITFSTHCSGGDLAGVGFRQAGGTHVDGFEINPKIAAVARLNGFNVHAMDVCQVDYAALTPVDHWHSSPSCKRASRANTNQGETADDLAVADSVVRLIRSHRGRTFTLENVIEYRWFESFDRICQALKDAGFLFRTTPKGGEKPAWRDSVPLWHDAGEFVDAADFGVPQNRKRLIVRAARGVDRLPGLRPTHGKRGGVLLERWNGWYGAVADILDAMPDTTPAPWQMKRMPAELRESMLIGAGGFDGGVINVRPDQPSFTITANSNQQAQLRAFMIGNNDQQWGDGIVYGDEPCFAVTTQSAGRARAYIVSSGSNGQHEDVPIRDDDEPVMTITTNAEGRMRAFLLNGENAGGEWGAHSREGNDPAFTISSASKGTHRAYAGGVWKKIDIRGLGCFQSVPDDYIGLTPEINGNGIPSLMARRILESLRGVYES